MSLSLKRPGAGRGRMSGEERRRQLIRVAIGLFSRKGFRGTTTKEVALAAGVSEAMIFRHFARKEDLYAAILDFKSGEIRTEDWVEALRGYAGRGDDEGLFRALGLKILQGYGRDHEFLRLLTYSVLEGHDLAALFRERHLRPLFEFLCEYIRRRQREGAFAGCHADTVVRAFIGMANFYAMDDGLHGRRGPAVSDEEAAAVFTRLVLRGLRRGRAAAGRVKKQKNVRK